MSLRMIALSAIGGASIAICAIIAGAAFRGYFSPPEGPIAERLAKVEHGWGKQTETAALRDLFPAGTRLSSGAKGPRGAIRDALRKARFGCTRFEPTREGPGLLICRNASAGYTPEGCRRDWLILLELPPLPLGGGRAEDMRSFVQARC